VKGLIGKDIAEAKKHLEMSSDFPFRGHGTPELDLAAIENAVSEEEMPPFRYRVMHPGSGINEKEREAIFLWIEDTRRELEEAARPNTRRENAGKDVRRFH
jgi:cytochrome c peroxidase